MKFKIENLYKTYEINSETHNVLSGLNLEGDLNKITVILGRSGIGKTTLLKLISGLESFDSGSVDFGNGCDDGTGGTGSFGTSRPGIVFQEPRLMPWLNVEKNITFGLDKKKDAEKLANLQKMIKVVGLEGFEKAYPSQLSGGMQHRVSLARVLILSPSLILMDEPFSALDYFTRTNMQLELLRIHRETNMGVIFVTHNIDEAILLGDKICILADGKIKAEFEGAEVSANVGNFEGFESLTHRTSRDLLSSECIELKKKILAEL